MADSIIVTVEGETLSNSMADQMVQQFAARQGVPPQMLSAFLAQAGPQMRNQVIEQFIDRVLLTKEAAKRELEPTAEEIDGILADMSKQIPDGMTVEQAIAAQGATLEQVRDDIAGNLRLQKLYELETADAKAVTDEEVTAFYEGNPDQFNTAEQASARHILIKCDGDASEEDHAKAKAEAEGIRTQVVNGGDFAELAGAHSACPSKSKGGDLGTFGRGQMVPQFEEAAFSWEIGEVGPVVKTDFGYHVLEVTDRTEARKQPFEEVSEGIRNHLESQARNEDFGAYAKSLRVGAAITYANAAE